MTSEQNKVCKRNAIEFFGLWEKLNNPNFKGVEFDSFSETAECNEITTHGVAMKSSKIENHFFQMGKMVFDHLVHLHEMVPLRSQMLILGIDMQKSITQHNSNETIATQFGRNEL